MLTVLHLLQFTKPVRSQGLATIFFYPSTTLKNHKRGISNVKFSYKFQDGGRGKWSFDRSPNFGNFKQNNITKCSFNQQNIDKIDTVDYLSSRNTDHNEFVLNQQRCHRCKQRKQKKNFP